MPVQIQNRPFASDTITGLMLPDGIFESSIGKQLLNAHFKNISATNESNLHIYVEGSSHPGIVITPQTHFVSSLKSQAAALRFWEIDVSTVPPGSYYISFIVENAGGRQRIIKKIFVTRVTFNSATGAFSAETPEGIFTVKLNSILDPGKSNCCCHRNRQRSDNATPYTDIFKNLNQSFQRVKFIEDLCPIVILPTDQTTSITPTPAFEGQYGDLPFNDPWWKVALLIIAFLLLVAAAIAEAVGGTGSITATAGCTIDPSTGATVCGPSASGGGTSYLAAGLVAAAAGVATAAGLSDDRDLHRIGQDHTMPGAGELTTKESLHAKIKYPEPIAPGKPFSVNIEWIYTRTTVDAASVVRTYEYASSNTNKNVHVLSRYEISAPDVYRVYKERPFLVEGRFFDAAGNKLTGSQLFVKCFLIHESGKSHSFLMYDDGINADKDQNDGTYTGIYYFTSDDAGMWKIYVIAQDINYAQQNMKPEEAAKIIGGMLLTNQLTITFSGGQCNLVPDGDVRVIT